MDRELSARLREYVRRAAIESKKPSTRAVQWREQATRELGLIMDVGKAAAASFEGRRWQLLRDENAAVSRVEPLLLQKAADLGFGHCRDREELAVRVFGQGFEEQPGTPEYEMLSYWQEVELEAFAPRYEDRSHEAERFFLGALTIAMRSILEEALQELLGIAQSCRPKDVSHKDLKDRENVLATYRQALERIHGLVIDEDCWRGVYALATVRNRFAHDLGRISPTHPQIAELRRLPGLKLEPSDGDDELLEIVVNAEHLEYCRSVIEVLVFALAGELSKWDMPRGV